MDFLSQTEQKLAAEISGNYQSLLEQQRDHEVRAFSMLMGANGWFCLLHVCSVYGVVNTNLCVCSCSRQRCLAGNRFSTPSSMMVIICWTKDQWRTGEPTVTQSV